jgi:hypothetical protein
MYVLSTLLAAAGFPKAGIFGLAAEIGYTTLQKMAVFTTTTVTLQNETVNYWLIILGNFV